MLSNTAQNLVATETRCLGFAHPCSNGTALANFRQVIVVACSVMSAGVISRSVTLLLKHHRHCHKHDVSESSYAFQRAFADIMALRSSAMHCYAHPVRSPKE
jgi:hypothetical protein